MFLANMFYITQVLQPSNFLSFVQPVTQKLQIKHNWQHFNKYKNNVAILTSNKNNKNC